MRRILEHLLLTGTVSKDDMNDAIAKVGERRAERELLAEGKLRGEDLAKGLAYVMGLEYVDLADTKVDPQAVATLAPELARRHYVLPLALNHGELTLAMVDPDDVIALDDVAGSTGLIVEPVVATREAMASALDRHVRLDSQIADLSTELGESAAALGALDTTENLEDDDDDAPIVRFVNLIIS